MSNYFIPLILLLGAMGVQLLLAICFPLGDIYFRYLYSGLHLGVVVVAVSCFSPSGFRRFTLLAGVIVMFVGSVLMFMSVVCPDVIAPDLGFRPTVFALTMVSAPVFLNGIFLVILGAIDQQNLMSVFRIHYLSRLESDRCVHCNYNLHRVNGRCPECGTARVDLKRIQSLYSGLSRTEVRLRLSPAVEVQGKRGRVFYASAEGGSYELIFSGNKGLVAISYRDKDQVVDVPMTTSPEKRQLKSLVARSRIRDWPDWPT